MPLRLVLAAELEGHEDRVWQVSWDPTGLRLASCSGDKSVRIWTPLTQGRFFESSSTPADTQAQQNQQRTHDNDMSKAWECVDTIDAAHKRTVRAVAFEPTRGRALATASFDGTTGIWEKEEGGDTYECIATLEGHENETKSVSWSSSGQLLATCGRDRSVWIWESNGEGDFDCISVLMEHTNDVKMVAWHPTQDLLASFSYDDSIRLWREDDDDWYSAATLTGHSSTVWAGAFSPDGRFLASVSDDRTVRLWAADASGAAAAGMRDGFYYKPDSAYQCVATVPDTVHSRAIYSVAWTKPTASLRGKTMEIADASSLGSDEEENKQHHQEGFLATGCGDNALRVFSVTTGNEGVAVVLECTRNQAHALTDINCVQWNPVYPHWLASAGDDGVVRIWRLESFSD
ncbi:Cytosolic iron-sulfur protein assembly protein [Coemansia sp. RSA 1939]|nr:Cytosolic iron-sulfur protein assembly protein [Coemansia sp. RSA 1939]